ncbi:hypothetical protein ACJU26_11045 [Acidithiobacillus sp. M4-SHS-6]
MPCEQECSNVAFARIEVIAHHRFVLFNHAALGEDWQHQPQ